jgi:hypothetical protein
VDEFRIWLDTQALLVLPKSALGKAITYCQGQWPTGARQQPFRALNQAVRHRQKELAVCEHPERSENERSHIQHSGDGQREWPQPACLSGTYPASPTMDRCE